MRDDIETNVQFIELVQKNPCLYDHTRPDYSNRNKQDKIWAEIAQELNETVTTCRDRWKNIRGRYVKQMNKPPSGSAAKSKKPYYLADYLTFLDTFIKSRAPTGNLGLQSPEVPDEISNSEEQSNLSNSTQDLSDIDEESTASLRDISQSLRKPTHNLLDTDTSATSTPEQSSSNVAKSNIKRLRNKNTATLSELNRTAINYFEERKRTQNSVTSVMDPDEAFLKSVLPDMKNMNEYQKRNFIVAVLHLAGQILNQPVIAPVSSVPLQDITRQQSNLSNTQMLLPQYSLVSQITDSPANKSNQNTEENQNIQDFLDQL